MSMGKTESIKERRVDVYLDTLERKERWKQMAEEADESLSTFVQHCVEYAIKQGGPDVSEFGQHAKKIQSQEQKIKQLQKEIKQKDIVIENLESDLKRYRMGPFREEDFEGKREYDEELIELLQRTDRVTSEEIVHRLDVDPADQELMQAVNNQLHQLESYGLIQPTGNGWRWVG